MLGDEQLPNWMKKQRLIKSIFIILPHFRYVSHVSYHNPELLTKFKKASTAKNSWKKHQLKWWDDGIATYNRAIQGMAFVAFFCVSLVCFLRNYFPF